jgi:hypothetical protein
MSTKSSNHLSEKSEDFRSQFHFIHLIAYLNAV